MSSFQDIFLNKTIKSIISSIETKTVSEDTINDLNKFPQMFLITKEKNVTIFDLLFSSFENNIFLEKIDPNSTPFWMSFFKITSEKNISKYIWILFQKIFSKLNFKTFVLIIDCLHKNTKIDDHFETLLKCLEEDKIAHFFQDLVFGGYLYLLSEIVIENNNFLNMLPKNIASKLRTQSLSVLLQKSIEKDRGGRSESPLLLVGEDVYNQNHHMDKEIRAEKFIDSLFMTKHQISIYELNFSHWTNDVFYIRYYPTELYKYIFEKYFTTANEELKDTVDNEEEKIENFYMLFGGDYMNNIMTCNIENKKFFFPEQEEIFFPDEILFVVHKNFIDLGFDIKLKNKFKNIRINTISEMTSFEY